MNRSFTFGCGQGATKAMIYCIENGTLDKNECCVVNSTIKDIPEDYRDRCIIISEDPDAGCGKVRAAAKKLMIDYLRNNPNVIEGLIPDDVQYVNILTTTEGASGSGASVVLAKWIESKLDLPVMITLICGFESDTRGLQNTIEYFKDLEGGNYVVKTVSNKRFLEKTSNTFVAERLANEDIATGIKVVNAFDIVDSEQNIDDTDHYKLITNPGMMFVTEVTFDKKIKNPNQFDQIVSDAIDYSSSLDFEPSATKIGVFMNISDDNLSVIDTSFSAIKKKLCGNNTIEEFFVHRQYVSSEPEFVRIIASGMNLPKEELQDMYAKYQKNLKSNTKDDDFFGAISGMETVTQQSTPTKKNTDDDFFSKFDSEETNEETDMVIRRSKRRRPTGSSGTPQATVNSDGYEKKKNVFTAKKTGSSNNSSPYSEDLINGNI